MSTNIITSIHPFCRLMVEETVIDHNFKLDEKALHVKLRRMSAIHLSVINVRLKPKAFIPGTDVI